jgi:hypothetical protein
MEVGHVLRRLAKTLAECVALFLKRRETIAEGSAVSLILDRGVDFLDGLLRLLKRSPVLIARENASRGIERLSEHVPDMT